MKVLIAGIDGYIGSVLSQVLTKKGHEISGVDTGFYREGWLYNGLTQAPKVINKDIRNISIEEIGGYDAVIHLADLSNDPLGILNKETTYAINHTAVVAFAKKAKIAGVKRYLYSSSCSVYGIAADGIVTEKSGTNPQTPYAECKLLVERGLKALASETFSPVFLRNATVFGISPRMRFDLVVNNLAGHAWVNKEIRLSSDGSPWRPLVHILDVCEAFALALTAPKETIHDQIFNVGINNGNYRIKNVADIVKREFPECSISFGKDNGDARSYRVSFEKINSKLPGFSATRDVSSGVKELKMMFERIGLTRGQFESRAYTRVKMVEYLLKTKQINDLYFWMNEL